MEPKTEGPGTVQPAFLHSNDVAYSWHESMRGVLDYDLDSGRPRIARKPLNIRTNTGRLVQSRNLAVRLFLDRTDHEWLWFTDTDMGFAPDTVERLLEAADPIERPIVGALCFALMEQSYDGMGGMRFAITPTMYTMGHNTEGHATFAFYGPYPDETVVPVAGTGAACILIHRSVLEKLRQLHGDTWFSQIADSKGDVIGEDLSFCARASAAGLPIHVHTGVKTTHHKQWWISEQDYMQNPLIRVDETPADLPDIETYIHVPASLESLAAGDHEQGGMWKLPADLERYAEIIRATAPEVIVETGTHTGASARWFAQFPSVREVITVDIKNQDSADVVYDDAEQTRGRRVFYMFGDSTAPETVKAVERMVAGRRCMVSLDSDHSAAHVAAEIAAYGPMVSAGCYLVVEDGIFAYAPPELREAHCPGLQGSPLDAIAELLQPDLRWSRDAAIERMGPVSHHPAGWWFRNTDEPVADHG